SSRRTGSESDPAATSHYREKSPAPTTGSGHAPADFAPHGPVCVLHPHHVSKILDEVLEEPEPPPGGRRFRHPMILDLILRAGLLVAMGGFTVGLFKMYLVHSAQQAIWQHNYKAAIGILKGAPA